MMHLLPVRKAPNIDIYGQVDHHDDGNYLVVEKSEDGMGLRVAKFESALYRICIVGYLDTSWSEYCGGMTIEQTSDPKFNTITLLTGRLIDQSALIGVLNSLYDIGCPIISVEYLAAG